MAKISTYIDDNNITNKDIVLGSDGDENNKTKNYTIQGLKNFFTSDFSASEQNNIIKSYTLPAIKVPDSTKTVLVEASGRINNLSPSLEIKSDEIYFFKLRRGNRFYVLSLKDLGKGFYGANELPISETNLQVISDKPLVVENISQDSTTDIISLGEIQPLNISEAVNNTNPPINIQTLSDGFTVFTVTVNGTVESYLFQGNSGLTGVGEQQTTLSDFNLVDQTGFETGDPIPEYLLDKDVNDLLLSKDATEVSRIPIPAFAFSEENVSRLKELVYEDGTISLSRTPSTFERNLIGGVSVTFNYAVTERDDTIVSANFDGNDVILSPDGSQTFNNVISNLSKTFQVTLQNSSDLTNRNLSLNRTAVSIAPQWKGSSNNNTGFNGESYVNLNTALSKIIQSSATTQITVPANDYGIFLSTKLGADIIETGTGFALAPSAYTEQSITVEFENGTPLNLTQYIINTSTGVFTYRLE